MRPGREAQDGPQVAIPNPAPSVLKAAMNSRGKGIRGPYDTIAISCFMPSFALVYH